MEEGKRLIITVLGHDQIGITAAIAAACAEANVNILDISQTILQGFFTMVMVVDSSAASIDIADFRDRISQTGAEFNLQVMVQHEDIFKFMHRI